MSKFKIGDRVKCIDNNNDPKGYLKLGDIYVVSKVDEHNGIAVEGSLISWWNKRFVLAEECIEEFQIW